MATISTADFSISSSVVAANGGGAGITVRQSFDDDNKNVSEVIVPDKLLFLENKAIASGTSVTVDLYDLGSLDIGNGSGLDNLGETHANSSINSILISCADDSAGTLRLDQTVANSWTGLTGGSTQIDLPAGGFFSINYGSAGKAVTDASSHLLTLTAVSGDVTATVIFVAN